MFPGSSVAESSSTLVGSKEKMVTPRFVFSWEKKKGDIAAQSEVNADPGVIQLEIECICDKIVDSLHHEGLPGPIIESQMTGATGSIDVIGSGLDIASLSAVDAVTENTSEGNDLEDVSIDMLEAELAAAVARGDRGTMLNLLDKTEVMLTSPTKSVNSPLVFPCSSSNATEGDCSFGSVATNEVRKGYCKLKSPVL